MFFRDPMHPRRGIDGEVRVGPKAVIVPFQVGRRSGLDGGNCLCREFLRCSGMRKGQSLERVIL
jgi:hypothetical protein